MASLSSLSSEPRSRQMSSPEPTPEQPPPEQRLLRRASTGGPPLLTPHTEEEDAESLDDLDLGKLLYYGSAFYTALNCMTYPLAVIKTRMQASKVQLGTRDAALDLYRVAGARGFYAGLLPTLCGALPARAGYITALEGTRPVAFTAATSCGMSPTSAAVISNGAAGFAAVLASQSIWTPWDVVTQRVMVAAGGTCTTESSFVGVSRSIASTSGWRGFYRGFGVTLIAYLPGGSVWWAAYGGAKEVAAQNGVLHAIPQVLAQAVAATWASFWTVSITSPLDVLKTRTQLAPGKAAPPILEMGSQLIREEGFAGLYRGFLPRWVQASIFTSCVIVCSASARTLDEVRGSLLNVVFEASRVQNIYEHLKRICRK